MFRGPSSTQNGACRPHRGRGIWPNPTRRTHGEDTQPNEIIDKRRTTVPPAIRTISTASKYTKPQWRGRGRDNPYLGRGRGTRFGFAPALHFRGTPGCNESVSSTNSHLTQRPSLNSASDAPSLSNRDLATQDRTVQIRHGDHALQNDITSTFTTPPNLYITPGLSEDRPTKRRRIEEGQSASCFGDTVSQLPTQHAHSFQGWIKRESLSPPPRPALSRPDPTTPIKNEARSPSPSPAVRRLVTSGCIRYTPMPMNCRRLDPMYKFHRKEWARNEVAILKTKGLRTTRWFAREDGMVIEWSSRIPVWSDTLEPEVSPEPPPIPDISPAPHQLHYDDRANTTALPKDLASQPQTRSAVRQNESSSPSRSNDPQLLFPREGDAGVTNLSTFTGDRLVSRFEVDALVGSQTSAAEPASPPGERGLETMALAFLERFVQHFDDDRPGLLRGYHADAFFSFRQHTSSGTPTSDPTSSILSSRNVFHGRERIGRALRLLESYKLCQEETSIVYDLLPQRDTVFMSCHGEATNVDNPNPHPIYFGQSFILRRNEDSLHTEWPLVVVSHQITIGNFPADIFIAN
ncbi:hypothetical protein BDN71DRAFT_118115 [Pleurotus eryngii]|uniref:NTF2 domain-containing protein n=1 Tax=Pleurotus eryngii TaxID=5323 RepID=A0A9P6DIL3_PLEER|nr:hypothetical protein BDN71DRAFT_118115 [Pleurotus eryngii]